MDLNAAQRFPGRAGRMRELTVSRYRDETDCDTAGLVVYGALL